MSRRSRAVTLAATALVVLACVAVLLSSNTDPANDAQVSAPDAMMGQAHCGLWVSVSVLN